MFEDLEMHEDEEFVKPVFKHAYVPLAQINLLEELARQLVDAKNLYEGIRDNNRILPNQKALVLNSLTSIITQITRAQESLHNVETLKRLEDALIETLKTLPADAQAAFFDTYKAKLDSL